MCVDRGKLRVNLWRCAEEGDIITDWYYPDELVLRLEGGLLQLALLEAPKTAQRLDKNDNYYYIDITNAHGLKQVAMAPCDLHVTRQQCICYTPRVLCDRDVSAITPLESYVTVHRQHCV